MANYFCANCGTAHGPGDVFCRNCGAAIRHQEAAIAVQPAAVAATPVVQAPPEVGPASYAPPPPMYQKVPAASSPVAAPMFAFEKAPKRSWPKVLGILAAVAVLLVIVVFVVIAAWPKPDPTVAVLATRDAFVNHDEQAFEQNVDVDAVLGDAIEQTLAYGASRATEGSSQGDKVVAQIGGAVLAQVLKNQEMNELHSDVQQLVSGVALDPQTSNQDETSVYLVPVMHVLLQAGVAYQGSTVLSQSGSTAEVAVNLQPAVGGPIELDLGLRFDNGRWRIVSLYHLDRLLAQYQSLFN